MRNSDHGERGCGRIGCCVPVHDFVRHPDPRFGVALGGGCGAQHEGVTCGWPEVAHRVADPASLVTRPQSSAKHRCTPCCRNGCTGDHCAGNCAGATAPRSSGGPNEADPGCVYPDGVCTCGEPEGHIAPYAGGADHG